MRPRPPARALDPSSYRRDPPRRFPLCARNYPLLSHSFFSHLPCAKFPSSNFHLFIAISADHRGGSRRSIRKLLSYKGYRPPRSQKHRDGHRGGMRRSLSDHPGHRAWLQRGRKNLCTKWQSDIAVVFGVRQFHAIATPCTFRLGRKCILFVVNAVASHAMTHELSGSRQGRRW